MEKKCAERHGQEKCRNGEVWRGIETETQGEYESRYGLAKHLEDTEEHGQDFTSTEMEKRSGDPQRGDTERRRGDSIRIDTEKT